MTVDFIIIICFSHPDDIDLFSGGMSETTVPVALVGPTFRCIIWLFKVGDRHVYKNDFATTGFTPGLLIMNVL